MSSCLSVSFKIMHRCGSAQLWLVSRIQTHDLSIKKRRQYPLFKIAAKQVIKINVKWLLRENGHSDVMAPYCDVVFGKTFLDGHGLFYQKTT